MKLSTAIGLFAVARGAWLLAPWIAFHSPLYAPMAALAPETAWGLLFTFVGSVQVLNGRLPSRLGKFGDYTATALWGYTAWLTSSSWQSPVWSSFLLLALLSMLIPASREGGQGVTT